MYNSTPFSKQSKASLSTPFKSPAENQLQTMQLALHTFHNASIDADLQEQQYQIINKLDIQMPIGCLDRLKDILAAQPDLH